MIVVVMGVSGCGKTRVGQALAERLDWRFLDADAFHPPANVAKMSRGAPLDDADRGPWLTAMNGRLRALSSEKRSVVLACSALKQRYRNQLAADLSEAIRWVHLAAPPGVIQPRLEQRAHFMPASLLASQYEALEPPTDALTLDAGLPVAELVEAIVRGLELERGPGEAGRQRDRDGFFG